MTSVRILPLYVVLVVSLGACSDRRSVTENSRKSVVSVNTRFVNSGLPLKQGTRRNGSAFLVNRRTLVTALHVVSSMRKEIAGYSEGLAGIYVERHTHDGELLFSVPAVVKVTDEENDLAVLDIEPDSLAEHFKSGNIATLEIARELPYIGQEVVMSGFRGKEPSPFTTFGTIALVADGSEGETDIPKRRIYASLTSLPGNSGSPIISTSSGQVVGVQLGALNWDDSPSSMAYAAHSNALTTLLSKYFVLNSNATK